MTDNRDTSSDMGVELELAARKIAGVITSVFESVDYVRERFVALHHEVVAGGERFYTDTDAEIASICGRLANFGIAPRHLRTFRTSTDREAGLLEAVIAPKLKKLEKEKVIQPTPQTGK